MWPHATYCLPVAQLSKYAPALCAQLFKLLCQPHIAEDLRRPGPRRLAQLDHIRGQLCAHRSALNQAEQRVLSLLGMLTVTVHATLDRAAQAVWLRFD